jgi:bacterioferritin (cytochrome b1)
MEKKDPLFQEIRERILEISADLDGELQRLASEGVITDLDLKKLRADAEASAQAVLEALEQTDYPQEMRREWAHRLVNQFETSAKETLAKARRKLYKPKRTRARLREIERTVLNRFGHTAQEYVHSNLDTIEQIRDGFVHKIHSIANRQPQDCSLVERQFQEYEERITELLQGVSPRLGNEVMKSRETVQQSVSHTSIPNKRSKGLPRWLLLIIVPIWGAILACCLLFLRFFRMLFGFM